MTTVRNSIAIATTLLSGAAAVNNGLAVTPPMGWVRCPLRSLAKLAGCGSNDNRTTGTLSAAMSLKIFFTPLRSKSLVWGCGIWATIMLYSTIAGKMSTGETRTGNFTPSLANFPMDSNRSQITSMEKGLSLACTAVPER
jgi:hypothetical protein